MTIANILDKSVEQGQDHTNGDSEKGQATDAFAPATQLLVYDRVGGEEQVERAVDDGHVDREEENYGLEEQ